MPAATQQPIIYGMAQGGDEWLKARAGIPTASEFDAIISPEWKARTGAGVATYLSRKLAERWLGKPIIGFSGGSMEQGKLKEEEAIPAYEFLTDQKIERVGFVTTADGRVGCSPDGLIGDDGGFELKCPEPHTHVGYLIAGVLPKDYYGQVYGGMFVTGRSYWVLNSYCRGFPSFTIRTERDDKVMEAIRSALFSFNERLAVAYDLMVQMNDGEPERDDNE